MTDEIMGAQSWQVRAALFELLALAFRYPDRTLAETVMSGEWLEAADEIAGVIGLSWCSGVAPRASEVAIYDDADSALHALRAEATRLFVGSPEPIVSPYEGVWRAVDDGVQPLLFVNPHSMNVERFCKACGLGRPEGTNEPLDHVATELELLEYLASRAAMDATASENGAEPASFEGVASADFPGGSVEAAYRQFWEEHASTWIPRFAESVQRETQLPFYAQAAGLLATVFS